MQTTSPFPARQQIVGDPNLRFWQIGEYGFVMNELLFFLRTVLSTKSLPFEIQGIGETKHASPNTFISPEASVLDSYFYTMQDFMSIMMPGYAYSPLLDLFFTCFQQHPWLRYCSFRDSSFPLSVVPMLEAEVFNDFVQMLRIQARRQNTLLHMRKLKSETECTQAESIKEYVPMLLSSAAWLEPIRIDFQYQKSVFSLADAMPFGQWIVVEPDQWEYVPAQAACSSDCPESRARIDTQAAMLDRARFFANIYRGVDKETFAYMRGYLVKMECGEDGAIHFHCCFFFDAKRPAQLTTEAVINVISSRWSRVTCERGIVFNCHEPSYQRKLRREGRWDLDLLADRDQRQVTRLTDYLIRYFACDKDQSLHVKPTAKSRTLTMAIG